MEIKKKGFDYVNKSRCEEKIGYVIFFWSIPLYAVVFSTSLHLGKCLAAKVMKGCSALKAPKAFKNTVNK